MSLRVQFVAWGSPLPARHRRHRPHRPRRSRGRDRTGRGVAVPGGAWPYRAGGGRAAGQSGAAAAARALRRGLGAGAAAGTCPRAAVKVRAPGSEPCAEPRGRRGAPQPVPGSPVGPTPRRAGPGQSGGPWVAGMRRWPGISGVPVQPRRGGPCRWLCRGCRGPEARARAARAGGCGQPCAGNEGTFFQPGPHGWGHRMSSPGTWLSRVGHIRNASYATGARGNDPWTAQGVCAL